jgi:hydroxymethylglutaryl-CoA lyase
MLMDTGTVEIVEVAPRDGFQPIKDWIDTDKKVDFVQRLASAGLRRIEIGAFVSPVAVPQMRDTAQVLADVVDLPGLIPQVLVPTAKQGRLAIDAGARFVAYVLSVSEAHNVNNVRRSVRQSVEDYSRLVDDAGPDIAIRLNLATTFDCPFAGRVADDDVFALLESLLALRTDIEVGLCDTTGKATPDQVTRMAVSVAARFPEVPRWAFHGHDTYGLGLANAYAAFGAGVRVLDASAGGLGGCPFAPGATGNVATEDVVWMLERMGIKTGVDIQALILLSREFATLPGASSGGRVREALFAGRNLTANA